MGLNINFFSSPKDTRYHRQNEKTLIIFLAVEFFWSFFFFALSWYGVAMQFKNIFFLPLYQIIRHLSCEEFQFLKYLTWARLEFFQRNEYASRKETNFRVLNFYSSDNSRKAHDSRLSLRGGFKDFYCAIICSTTPKKKKLTCSFPCKTISLVLTLYLPFRDIIII